MGPKLLQCVIISVVCFIRCSHATPPHIVFVVADDLGWNDVGWHNPKMKTPNLNHYATRGVILQNAYVQPVCTPSRACFMTGYYPFHIGLQHRVVWPRQAIYLPTNFTLLPQWLKTAGYATHAVGKWHLGHCAWKYTPTERGFDSFLGFYCGGQDYYTRKLDDGYDFRLNKDVTYKDYGMYSPAVFSAQAERIIRSHDQTKPLFLYLAFQSVHTPLQVPKQFENMCADIKQKDRRIFCGMVAAMDEAFGNVTRALEETGMDDNLLLIFSSDNGGKVVSGGNNWPFRGGKTTTWEGGTKAATFVYSKHLLSKTGYLNDQMIHCVDWAPTLLELAGVPPETGLDGVSQLETLVSGAPSKRREFVYNIDEISNRSALRWGDFKLIQGGAGTYNDWYRPPENTTDEDDEDEDDEGEEDEGEEEKMQQHTAADTTPIVPFPEYMLFNIREDPTEREDLSQKRPEVLEQMKGRLQEWRKSLVPAQNPLNDSRADAQNFNYVWSPGWC